MVKEKSLTVGQNVIIRHNPHQGKSAENLIATVKRVRPGEGFMGVNLYDLEYNHPASGETHHLPFGACNFELASKEKLNELASTLEAKALEYRRLAKVL